MKKTWLEIYALLVCFVCVTCVVIVTGLSLWNIIEMSAPEFAMDSATWTRLSSDEQYKSSWEFKSRYCDENSTEETSPKNKCKPAPQDANVTEQRLTEFALKKAETTRSGFRDFVQHLIVLLVSGVALFFHWRIANRARST